MFRSVSVLFTMMALGMIVAICLQSPPSALARGEAAPVFAAEEQLTFEVYKDAQSEYRWRLKSPNKQTIGSSGQGYRAKSDCEHAISVIKDNAAKAKIEEVKE